jgi:predicted dehydrogenase
VNIALAGMGFMGATHLQALRTLPDVRVAGVITRDARKIPADLPALSLEQALADQSIAALDLCLPTHLHAPVATEALRAGKHVLVEKPMAMDAASAEAMAAEAERQGRILMTAQVLRFWRAYTALRDAVRGNRFGSVRHARFERRSAVPAWGPWLLDPSLSGGGAFDLLIHDVDMCLHLFGMPSGVAAVAHADTAAGTTLLDAQLYYPGLVAHISGGWQHPGTFPFRMEYTVTFERATIEYSSLGRPATLYSAGETRPLEVGDGDPFAAAYAAEIAYFLDCCRTGGAPALCPPRESAAAVALTLLLVEASKRNGEKIECTTWNRSNPG